MRIPLIVIIVTYSISIVGLMLIEGKDANGNPYYMNFFDAFYFVSYMASTIGFGEAPYEFNYSQRMWVSFSIYLTVVGWFYGIGSLVALVQDKRLSKELAIAAFKRKVEELSEKFVIILGYNNITRNIINRLNEEAIRVVVIDKNEDKINEIDLENFIPEVPAIAAEATDATILKIAGIYKNNCRAVIALFEDDAKNSKVALLCKILNKKVDVVVKSTTKEQTEHLRNIGIKHIENPFKIISKRIYLALIKPHIWILEMWIFGHLLKIRKKEILPKGKYVICGYGRMGHALEYGLKKAGIETVFIDIVAAKYKTQKRSSIYGDAEDMRVLLEAGIKEASGIIAATKDDLINLTIISTARKLNPSIYTIARENSLEDLSIFKASKIDRIYILEEILADYTFTFIAKPMAHKFIKLIRTKDDRWGEEVVKEIQENIGENPLLSEIKINKENAFALCSELENGANVTLRHLKKSRENYKKTNKIVFLFLKRKEKIHLMPSDEMEVKIDDEILFASDKDSKNDLEYIIDNYYELNYALTGKEKSFGVLAYFFKNQDLL
jgi:Trk K+ transport system NAD-binding subunit